MPSNGRNLSRLLGANQTIPEEKLSADIVLGPEQYATPDDLPLSGNQVGDQAFVGSSNRLYIWSGSGWYSVALINTSPAFDSGGSPEAEYVLDSIGGTATTITLLATDPEGVPIQYSAIPSDSANDLATITQTENVFVVTARSLDSVIANGYDSTGGTFSVTFRASDGVNLATALSEFTLAFAVPPYTFQGSNFGYASGGNIPPSTDVIDKFPFSSDANATDVGDLTIGRYSSVGQSSSVSGYTSGGYGSGSGTSNVIDKFPFAADANATDVGDLTVARFSPAGQSSSENGYTSGGIPETNVIDKFPFSADANASDVGDLTEARSGPAGQSSSTHGYTSGGNPVINIGNVIDKFPFAADANAVDVADLSVGRGGAAGQSSTENGYTSGGARYVPPAEAPAPPLTNVIDKFPFASDANATDVGDLTFNKYLSAGQSSTNNGYTSGGSPGSNIIDKFPFTSDANATDVGDLTVVRYQVSGQQY